MRPRVRLWMIGVSLVTLLVGSVVGISAQYAGWLIPDGARDEKSPVTSVAQAVTRGKYKVWNGHSVQLREQREDMPAFAGVLSKADVWAVVEFLKVLRTPLRQGGHA